MDAVFTSLLPFPSPGRAYGGGTTGATASACRTTAKAKGPSVARPVFVAASASSDRSRKSTSSPPFSSLDEEFLGGMAGWARCAAADVVAVGTRCAAFAVSPGRTGVGCAGCAAMEAGGEVASVRRVQASMGRRRRSVTLAS